jgi:hypothetical protein
MGVLVAAVGDNYLMDEGDHQDLGRMRHLPVGRFPHVRGFRGRLNCGGVSVPQDCAVNSHGDTMDVAFASVGADLFLAREKVGQSLGLSIRSPL